MAVARQRKEDQRGALAWAKQRLMSLQFISSHGPITTVLANAPAPLLERLATIPGMGPGRRRLVVLLPQLGDFDSLEYAQALVAARAHLEAAGIAVVAIGIGAEAGRQRFSAFTGLPLEWLLVEPDRHLHRALGLYPGLELTGGAWPNLLLMCAGIGSPGTLAEVLRGYTGDRMLPSASPRMKSSRRVPCRQSGDRSSTGRAAVASNGRSSSPR